MRLLRDKVTLAYCAKFDQLPGAMKAVKPTIFVGVPRVYEKIRQAVEGKSVGSVKKKILNWALGVGKAHRTETLEGRTPGALGWKLADKLVFSKIREAFGGEAKVFVSGGAPLGMDTAGWFADVGIRIFEGYGLTETSPVIALNYPKDASDWDGGEGAAECRGAGLPRMESWRCMGRRCSLGIGRRRRRRRRRLPTDGWFKTGDIGNIDSDGFLSITDRKKELLKTSGGKLIAPQPIENKLKANALVGNAALVGDKHKFACVLISPNFAALEGWAKGQGIAAGRPCCSGEGCEGGEGSIRGLWMEVNSGLAHYESMKRVSGGAGGVVGRGWDADAEHEAEAASGGEEICEGDRASFMPMRPWRRDKAICRRAFADR